MNYDLINIVVAIIAIITFLPFFISTLSTPSIQLIYETNTARMAFRVFNLVFNVLMHSAILCFVYFFLSSIIFQQTHTTFLSYFTSIYFLLVAIKKFIFKANTTVSALVMTESMYILVGIVLIVSSQKNIGVILISIFSGAILITNYFSISKKNGKCIFLKFRDKFIQTATGREVYRLTTTVMTLVGSIFLGLTLRLFAFSTIQPYYTFYALIFGALAIILFSELNAISCHNDWTIMTDYCFMKDDFQFFLLDSLTENIAALTLYAEKKGLMKETVLVPFKDDDEPILIKAEDLIGYKRVKNPIPNAKYF
ncbi:MAG: hypothetical protein WC363_02060 [Candidatus Izemoplasmatales bacterium]|jgi:hypothetical protein